MTTLIEGVGNAVKAVYCANAAVDRFLLGGARRAVGLGGLQNFAETIQRSICNGEPGPVPALDPPFTGGQCPGTIYSFGLGQTISGSCGVQTTFSPGVIGPISNIDFEIINVGGFPNPLRGILTVTGANGTFQSQQVQGNLDNPPCFTGPIPTSGPDDCGDPPPDIPPPGPVTFDIDITYGDENEFTINVPVIFAPVNVEIDGTLSIPFTIEDLNLNGELNLDGTVEITFDFGNGKGDPNTDDDPPAPEPGDDDDPPDDVPEDEPDDELGPIVAVIGRAAVVSDSLQTRIFYPRGPVLYAPRVGVVRFEFRVGAGRFFTPDIAIKGQNFIIPCPIPWGAVAAVVSPDPGVALTWQVVRGQPTTISGALTIDDGGQSDRR